MREFATVPSTLRFALMPATAPRKLYVVRNSAIHGRGVFASTRIPKGDTVIEYKGQRTSWDDAMERPDSDPDDPSHTFLFELDDGRVIDARVRGNAARWINHSCAPNCETYEDENGRVFIQARKKIEEGVELTYDYKLSVDGKLTKEERARFECRCGTAKCRGSLLTKTKKQKKKEAKAKAKKKDKKGKSKK